MCIKWIWLRKFSLAFLAFIFSFLMFFHTGSAFADDTTFYNMTEVNPQEQGSPDWLGNTSTWDCYFPGNALPVQVVTIDWGHTQADAVWACNRWRDECNNQCNEARRRSAGLPPAKPEFPRPIT